MAENSLHNGADALPNPRQNGLAQKQQQGGQMTIRHRI